MKESVVASERGYDIRRTQEERDNDPTSSE